MARIAKANISFLVLAAIVTIVAMASNASAGIDTLPETLAGALGVSESVAKMMLGTAILMSAGLCLAVADANVMLISVVMLTLLGVLVLMDWIYEWVLLVAIITIVAMFARTPMSDWFAHSGRS